MCRAVELAARGLGHTRPNPAVGAVIVKGGKIVGEGWHKKAGKDHAEVAAIKNAARRGAKILKGATIYVTLSPCLMCSKMIVNAGIREVVYDEEYSVTEQTKAVLAEAGVVLRRLPGYRRPTLVRADG
mgnify:CR=1 FL=1